MKRLRPFTSLVLLAVLLAACGSSGGSSGSSPTTAASRPATTAKLEIQQPTANEVTGPDITVVLEVIGGTVVSRTTGKLSPTEGHIHVSIDGKLVTMAYGTTQDLHDLTPGTHTLQAEFVALDHAPFRNRAVAQVLFTVKAP